MVTCVGWVRSTAIQRQRSTAVQRQRSSDNPNPNTNTNTYPYAPYPLESVLLVLSTPWKCFKPLTLTPSQFLSCFKV